MRWFPVALRRRQTALKPLNRVLMRVKGGAGYEDVLSVGFEMHYGLYSESNPSYFLNKYETRPD